MQLKNKILKIIPEHTFLMKAIKKVYGSLLYLKFLLSKKSPRVLNKLISEFIEDQQKDSKIFLNVSSNGNELIRLKSMENLLALPGAPNIIYKTYGAQTQKFGYHPVEIMWLLDQYGYSFFILDNLGKVVARRPREYEGIIVAIKTKT